MQFSYLLSAFLATLAIASPIANPSPAPEVAEVVDDLVARTDDTAVAGVPQQLSARWDDATPMYNAIAATGATLNKDQWYWFKLTWDLNTPVGDGESPTELQKLQQRLGYNHVAIVVGRVAEIAYGPPKSRKYRRDFQDVTQADLYVTEPDTTTSRIMNWNSANPGKTLHYGGTTTASKGARSNLKKIGESSYGVEYNQGASSLMLTLPRRRLY